jgi:hypothetical protein
VSGRDQPKVNPLQTACGKTLPALEFDLIMVVLEKRLNVAGEGIKDSIFIVQEMKGFFT